MVCFDIFNSNYEVISDQGYTWPIAYECILNLKKGEYFIKFYKYSGEQSNYNFIIKKEINDSNENNDTFATAKEINENVIIDGIAVFGEKDYYKITVKEKSKLSILATLIENKYKVQCLLYDTNYKCIDETRTNQLDMALEHGTYYILFISWTKNKSVSYNFSYSLTPEIM